MDSPYFQRILPAIYALQIVNLSIVLLLKSHIRGFADHFHKIQTKWIVIKYCETVIVQGVSIFMDFVGLENHKIWYPTKRKCLIFMEELSNPRTQESTNWSLSPKPWKLAPTNKSTVTVLKLWTKIWIVMK